MLSAGDWLVVGLVAVSLVVIFHGPIFRVFTLLLSRRDSKGHLYSEMHAMLEISIKQNAAIIEMRDLMRAWLDTQLTVPAINQVRDAIRDYPRLDMEPVLAKLQHLVECADFSEGPLASIDKNSSKTEDHLSGIRQSLVALTEAQPKILDRLEKNDQRMFEFVNATKGIMKAISGEGEADDDILIDEARRIKAYAAEQGIEMSIEDCMKRARSKMTYNRG